MSEHQIRQELSLKGFTLTRIAQPALGSWMVVKAGDRNGSNSPMYFDCLHDVEAWFKKEK